MSQGFNWESHRQGWYKKLMGQVKELASAGFTCIWMPPPSDSVSPQGYLPRDLYHLDCNYGTEADLRQLIQMFHEEKIKVIADIVINHRCASFQVRCMPAPLAATNVAVMPQFDAAQTNYAEQ